MGLPAALTLGLTLALTLALLVATFNPYLGDFGDDAEFVVLGQGLAAGHGYAWVNSPDHPAHNRYPPGYPALLAATMTVTGTTSDAFAAVVPAKVVTAAMFLGSIALLWPIARRRLPPAWAAAAVALFALNPVVIRFAVQVMSDVPYVAALLATLVWAQRPALDRGRRDWIILGALLALGAYVRSIGLPAAAGVLAWAWLTRRRDGAALATIVFLVAMLPWWLRDAALAGGWRYLEELFAATYTDPTAGTISAGGLASRALDNAAFFLGKPAALGPPGFVLAIPAVALLGIGAWRSARLGGGAAEWAAALICVSVLLWPIKTGRYLLPVVPLAGVYAVAGTYTVLQWWRRRHEPPRLPDGRPRASPGSTAPASRWAGAAAAMAIAAAFSVLIALDVRQAATNLDALRDGAHAPGYYRARPEWAHYLEAAGWLRANAGPNDVIMARRHFAMYVYSGRSTEKYRFDTSEEEIAYLTAGSAPKYVVEDAFDYLRGDFDALPAALRERGGDLVLRYETAPPVVRIWELIRP